MSSTRKTAQKSEVQGASSLTGGELAPNSGATGRLPGDFSTALILVEDKTRAKIYRLDKKTWDDTCQKAELRQRIPVFRVTLGGGLPMAALKLADWKKLGGGNVVQSGGFEKSVDFRRVAAQLYYHPEGLSYRAPGLGAFLVAVDWKVFSLLHNKAMEAR